MSENSTGSAKASGAARTALVTGASSGIGRATATALLARGYRVIGTSRDPRTVTDPPPGVEFRALDLCDPASVDALADVAGAVDVLVNNAGESQSGPLEELPAAALERVFRLNVLGAVQLTQLVLPVMRARGFGRVVMVGSMLASFPLAHRSSYVATKAAIKGFATAAHHEVSPFGVWMTTVEPGSIRTGISERRTIHVGPDSPYAEDLRTVIANLDRNEHNGISAEKVAATVVRAVEARKHRSLYAVGSRAPLVFTARRLLPASVIASMSHRAHGLRR